MKDNEISLFKGLFIAAALWNLAGGILGYFNTEFTFNLLFERELTDPLYHAIYKGACGTTLVYFIGYFVVAHNPIRHTGIVLVGGIGKVGFAIQLTKFYLAGIANDNALVVIVGDFAFTLAFLYYYFRLARTEHGLFGSLASLRAAPADA
ncbi:MAG: hypothetical protein AB8I08_20415 [Sandaracinaceae bacterium]